MRRAVYLLAIGLTLASRVIAAEPTSDIDRDLKALADPDPDARFAAKQSLMGLPADQLPKLKERVEASRPLKPAQVESLQDVVTYVAARGEIAETITADRPFLGVSFSAFDDNGFNRPAGAGGTVVMSRLQGFVAYRYLLDGDVIVSIKLNDAFLPTDNGEELKLAIATLRVGQPVTLTVRRGPTTFEVTFPVDGNLPPDPRFGFTAGSAEAAHRVGQAYWHDVFRPIVESGEI